MDQGRATPGAVVLKDCAAMIVPTVPTIFSIEQMLADPMKRNTAMGTYTYFVNPLDLCAVSVPGAMRDDGSPSALCFTAVAAQDGALRAIAQLFEASWFVGASESHLRLVASSRMEQSDKAIHFLHAPECNRAGERSGSRTRTAPPSLPL